ncbi:MAG: type II secretion system protein GspG [Pseudomonadota bacterium]
MKFTWIVRPREIRSESGMTFADFLLYLSAILALVAFSLPNFLVREKTASQTERQIVNEDLALIGEAILLMEAETGFLAGLEGPNPCVNTSEAFIDNEDCGMGIYCDHGVYPNWQGPYLNKKLVDPWGQAYYIDNDYRGRSGLQRVVGSMGPNGIQDFYGQGDDIVVILCKREG